MGARPPKVMLSLAQNYPNNYTFFPETQWHGACCAPFAHTLLIAQPGERELVRANIDAPYAPGVEHSRRAALFPVWFHPIVLQRTKAMRRQRAVCVPDLPEEIIAPSVAAEFKRLRTGYSLGSAFIQNPAMVSLLFGINCTRLRFAVCEFT